MNKQAALQQIDEQIAQGPFAASWDSLERYTAPDWYQDGSAVAACRLLSAVCCPPSAVCRPPSNPPERHYHAPDCFRRAVSFYAT
jgi:hypothetical protein